MEADLKERLAQLRQRLLVANLRSRSLRLRRTTRSGAFDLWRFERLGKRALDGILHGMGRSEPRGVELLPVKGTSDEARTASEDLRRLANAAHRTWLEVGESELQLGWPFLEGKSDDTWLRAPLLLYPVELRRTRRGLLTWQLTVTGRPDVNEVLSQALARLAGVRLELERLVQLDDDNVLRPDDPSWAALEQWVAEGGLSLPEAGYGMPRLRAVEAVDAKAGDDYPEGRFELRNHLVLGRFPQSSSAVLSEYNELEERPELLEQGPAAELLAIDAAVIEDVAARVDNRDEDEVEPSPDAADDELGERDTRVLPSDASQEAVIRAFDRLKGRGLVVRGPPGTGKSQLIANLVGEAIARGERLLVVCQKRAALDVVQERLASLGLAEPLALVHDIHHDREAFSGRLVTTLEKALDTEGQADLSEAVRREKRAVAKLAAARKRYAVRLDAGREAYRRMTRVGAGGRSLAELCERALSDDGRPLPDMSAAAASVVADDVTRTLPDIEALAAVAAPFAPPHPLAARADWSALDGEGRTALRDRLVRLRAELLECVERDEATMAPKRAERYAALWEECAPVLDLFEADDLEGQNQLALFWAFTDAGQERRAFDALENRLEQALEELPSVPPALFGVNSQQLMDWFSQLGDLDDLSQRWWRVFVPRFWRLRKLPSEIHDGYGAPAELGTSLVPAADAPVTTPDAVARLCETTLHWHQLVRDVAELVGDHPFFEFGCRGQLDDVRTALAGIHEWERLVDQIRRIRTRLAKTHPDYRSLPDFGAEVAYGDLPLLRAALADRAQFRRMAAVRASADQLGGHLRPEILGPLVERAEAANPETGALDELLAVWSQAPEAVAVDRRLAALPPWAADFLRRYRVGHDAVSSQLASFDPGRLADDLRLAMERAWRSSALEGKTTREAEAALIDESHRTALARAYDELIERASPAVYASYIQRLRRAAAVTEGTGRLLRRVLKDAQKKRYRLSIRQFVERYWDSCLPLVRPVWLCSPESVAALFPLESGLFDRVVMDEASQCPVESALPALIRARRLIVAGDEKQMPPSHFFTRRDDDEDFEEDDGEDSVLLSAESILDVARVAYPGTMLRFHYRSRYEELITFSNHAFYGGRLVTAPRAEVGKAPFDGMHFEQLDGRWRDQTNRVEAERVIEVVLELLRTPLPGDGGIPTIGIITFNQKQQQLVEALLDERAVDDPEAGDLLAADRDRAAIETLFVKNIENVQGDERDIIVFSMGYGPQTDGGRVHARFGPIGHQGGENRLNVAITRAKRGVLVIASFAARDLDTSGTKHVGPKLLRAYLDYAEQAAESRRGEIGRVLSEVRDLTGEGAPASRSALSERRVGLVVRDALATRLEATGLQVERDFGIGPYRLDLAVRDPDGGERWACGVDCTRFLRLSNTLQRDVTEPAFWTRAGWRVFRVSPGLWLERSDDVVSAILLAVTPELGSRGN